MQLNIYSHKLRHSKNEPDDAGKEAKAKASWHRAQRMTFLKSRGSKLLEDVAAGKKPSQANKSPKKKEE